MVVDLGMVDLDLGMVDWDIVDQGLEIVCLAIVDLAKADLAFGLGEVVGSMKMDSRAY